MQASQTPTLVPLPFAANGTKNTIPEASQISVTPGAASLNDGFPPLTFTPVAAGGVPPFGADFNGILNLICQTIRWKQAGGQFAYNAGFAGDANVGGYPNGAILQKASLKGLWINTVDNNATNPDTGGAGWVDLTAGRLLRTTIYNNPAGTLQSSVDGSAYAPASSTFTPLAATAAVTVELVGAGGGGGGAAATGASQCSFGAGGGGGGYCYKRLATGFSGATVTVGQGGAGGLGAAASGAGGSTSFGASVSATGGGGGTSGAAVTPTGNPNGSGACGAGVAADVNGQGGVGQYGLGYAVSLGGEGGYSQLGAGGVFQSSQSSGANGNGGGGYGGGGGGAANNASNTVKTGGVGIGGLLIVREFS